MGNSINQEVTARFDFSKGINSRHDKISLLANEVVDAYNFHITPRGRLRKRGGIKKALSTDTADNVPVVSLYQFRASDTDVILRVKNGKIEKLTPTAWVDRTNAQIITNNPDIPVQFATHRQNCIVTDSINPIIRWNGDATGFVALSNTIAASTTLDRARVVVQHRNRLIFGDVTLTESGTQTRYPSRLVATVAGTLESWDSTATGHSIDVGDGDGDGVTAAVDIYGTLVVWKNRSLWKVSNYGLSGAQDVRKIADVGCPGPGAVVAIGTSVYFLDERGQLWRFTIYGQDEDSLENLSVDRWGAPVLDLIDLDRLDSAYVERDFTNAEVLCTFSMNDSDEHNITWAYNIVADGWTRLGWDKTFSCMVSVRDYYGIHRLIAGGYNGVVYQLETGKSDDGSDIEVVFIGKSDGLDNVALIKRLAEGHIYIRVEENNTAFTLESRENFKTTGVQYPLTASPPGADSDPPGESVGGTEPGDTSSTPDPGDADPKLTASQGSDPVSVVATTPQPTGGNAVEVLSVIPSTSEDAFFTIERGTGALPQPHYLRRYDALTHTEEFEVSLGTHSAGYMSVLYVPSTDTVWVIRGDTNSANDQTVTVYNASTGASVTSFTAASKSFSRFITGPDVYWNGFVFIFGDTDGAGTPFHYLVLNASTYAAIGTIDTNHAGGTDFSILAISSGGFYDTDTGTDDVVVRVPASSTFSIADLVKSDHGHLDGSAFSGGTADGNFEPEYVVYDADKNLVYVLGYDNDIGSSSIYFQICSGSQATHADGTPHSPAHTYVPSTTGSGTEIKNNAAAVTKWIGFNSRTQGAAFHRDRSRIYQVARDGSTYNLYKIKPAYTNGTIAQAALESTTSWTMTAGTTGAVIYVPTAGVIVTVDGAGGMKTFS